MQQEVKTQIYSGMFIHLDPLVKKRIIEIFNIPKNGMTHVVDTTIYSDGYLDRDLAVLSVNTIREYLSNLNHDKTILEETDLFKLWNSLINKIEKEIAPKEETPVEKEKVTMTVKVNGEDVVLEGNTKKDAKAKKDSNKN